MWRTRPTSVSVEVGNGAPTQRVIVEAGAGQVDRVEATQPVGGRKLACVSLDGCEELDATERPGELLPPCRGGLTVVLSAAASRPVVSSP